MSGMKREFERLQEHPLALTLSLLIHAEGLAKGSDDFEAAVHTCIEKYLDSYDFCDEKRGDLYSLIVEALARVHPDRASRLTHSTLRRVCNECLHINESWANRHG